MAEPLRIFISSPGNVEEERRRAAIVVGRLAREFARFFEIKPVLWEYEPMLASGHFQDIIEPPSRSDIEVVILWSRLGTPLPAERYRGIDGRAPVTGTEWEFEDALKAHRERGAPDLLVYRKKTKGIAEFDSTEELEAAALQRKALEQFWERYFGSAQSGFKAAFNLFTDRDEFEQMLESHLRTLIRERLPRLAESRRASAEIAWHQGSPYRGLQYFDLEHAPIFFGRARAQRQVTEALARRAAEGSAFVLVLGMSGCGKSSLVRAGVLPELMTPGVVSGVGMWRHCVFRPSEGEGDLIGGLIRALSEREQALPELLEGGLSVEQVSALVRDVPHQATVTIAPSLKRAAERVKGIAGEGRLILVIDQLEEMFSLPSVDKEARERFVTLIAALAESRVVWVIGVMRSDFYHRAAELPVLVRLAAGRGSYLLTEPTAPEIAEMINQPAAAAGLAFEVDAESGERLDRVLQEAAAREPGALPLLEFALDQLYRKDIEEKHGEVLTFASYRDLGELRGAVARHADEVCDALPADARAALPSVLRALVTVGSGEDRATARAVRRDEIGANAARAAVIDRLIEARLLVSSEEEGAGQVRLAHDMLIASWPRLRDLVAEDRDFLRTRERVDQAAVEWERRGRADDFLLPGGRSLAEAEDLLARRSEDIESRDRLFIETSVRRERAQRERRLKQTRAVAAVMGLLAVVAAGFGWYAYDRRAAAERNYEIAVRAAQTLVRDVADRLRNLGLPAASVRDILTSAESLYKDLTLDAASRPDLLGRKAETLMSLADTYAALGDTGAERKRAEEARAAFLDLIAKHPNDTTWQRDLSVSQNKVGDALRAQGDLAGALESYRAGLDTTEKLAARDASNAVWQRDLAISHERIGDTLTAEGDLGGALASYRKGLAIHEALAKRNPSDSEGQRDLSVSDNKIGDALRNGGEPAEALKSYRAGLAIMEALTAKDPSNTQWLRDLAISHERIGNVLRIQGDETEALASYRKSLAIHEQLAARDLSNTVWQLDVSIGNERIGDMLASQGNLAEALKSYRTSLGTRERLVARDPSNSDWQRDLSVGENKVGDVLRVQGDAKGALASYRTGLDIMEKLVARDPSNAGWQRDVSISYERIGDALAAQGNQGEALASYRKSLDIREKLAARDPSNIGWTYDLSISNTKIGDALRAQGDQDGALASYRTELAIVEKLAARDPTNAEWQRNVSVGQNRIGDVLRAKNDLGGALASYRTGLAVMEKLSARDRANALWQHDLCVSYERIGDVLALQRDPAGALAYYRQELELIGKLAAANPSNLSWQRELYLTQNRVGNALAATGDQAGALASFRAGLETISPLASRDPSNTGEQHDLAVSHERIASALSALGNQAEALASYNRSLEIIETLLAKQPSNTLWQHDRSYLRGEIATLAKNSPSGSAQ